MKFGRLIEYDMRTFFLFLCLKNHLENVAKETIPRPFSKDQN